jgi:hypothetical protein
MIRLFRKDRQNAFSKNNITNYLLYGIGEIILVVVGILIALYIDTQAEERKNEEKIKAILKEIQVDLGEDIQKAEELIHYYQMKDSLIKQVFTDTLTAEDYQGRSGLIYFNIVTNFADFKMRDNGFTNLMRNSDIIPAKYEPLLGGLKQIYITDKKRIEANLLTMENFVLETMSRYAREYPWFSGLFQGKITDEIIDFHLNDPFYKNELIRYDIMAAGNLLPILRDFEQYAIVAYTSIAEELEPEKALPDFIGEAPVRLEEERLQAYVGRYEFQEGLITHVTVKGQQLFLQLTGQPQFEVFAESETTFTNSNFRVKIVFNENEQGEVSSFTLFQRGQEVGFIKLEE